MKRVAIYHQSVPSGKNRQKIEALERFSRGVSQTGDLALDCHDLSIVTADVGVIQGWTSTRTNRPHLWLRSAVVEAQQRTGGHSVAIDACLFLWAQPDNPHNWLRYSFNGIFPTTGIYCDTLPDPERWERVQAAFNIRMEPWRDRGSHILLCLQRNGGWSMDGIPVLEWAADVILRIREHSDRPIIVRPHPGDKGARDYLGDFSTSPLLKDVRLSSPLSTLQDDLRDCWAAVNHNSSPVVGALLNGIPVFVTDPLRSQCREVANTDFSQIETPILPDRVPWAQRISMSHWSFDEVQSGEAWNHMRKFIG